MAYLLGGLLGAAAVAALQALAVAYVVGLLIASGLVAALPVLVATAAVPSTTESHWWRRPAALGALLGAGTAGAVVLAVRLIGQGEDVHFVRPFVPGAIAAPIDLVLVLWLAWRGARRARDAVRGGDVKAGAQSLAGLGARALSRAVAVVIHGAATVVLIGCVGLAFSGDDPEGTRGSFVVLGAVGAFLVSGVGALFAWWGRARRAG